MFINQTAKLKVLSLLLFFFHGNFTMHDFLAFIAAVRKLFLYISWQTLIYYYIIVQSCFVHCMAKTHVYHLLFLSCFLYT